MHAAKNVPQNGTLPNFTSFRDSEIRRRSHHTGSGDCRRLPTRRVRILWGAANAKCLGKVVFMSRTSLGLASGPALLIACGLGLAGCSHAPEKMPKSACQR